MLTLDLCHDPGLDVAARSDLSRVLDDLDRNWPGLPRAIVLPYSDRPVVVEDRGTPWLYGPAWCDPQLGEHEAAVLPRRVRTELRRVAGTRFPFDAAAVAHELDPDGPVRVVRPLLAGGPRTCTDEVARELVGPVPDHPGVARAVTVLDRLVGGDSAWFDAAVDTLLDPIVFGVVAPFGLVEGAPAAYQPLVAWRW